MDGFLKSRPSKGNLELPTDEDEIKNSTINNDAEEEEDATGHFTDLSSLQAPSPLPPSLLPSLSAESSVCNPKRRKITTLKDVSESACTYFETKQRLLQNKKHADAILPDSDMGFLQSLLPDIKAMDENQKRKFKIRVLQLADEILTGELSPHRSETFLPSRDDAMSFESSNISICSFSTSFTICIDEYFE